MSGPSGSNNAAVVGLEWRMDELFEGTFEPSYAALAVLYHHRITQALFNFRNSPHSIASSVMQRRLQVGLYYEVVSLQPSCIGSKPHYHQEGIQGVHRDVNAFRLHWGEILSSSYP